MSNNKISSTSKESYTVVANEHLVERHGQSIWITELNFWYGDITKLFEEDLSADWRFCEVKGKRKQARLLGLTYDTLPIKWPLNLTNGTIIQEGDYD